MANENPYKSPEYPSGEEIADDDYYSFVDFPDDSEKQPEIDEIMLPKGEYTIRVESSVSKKGHSFTKEFIIENAIRLNEPLVLNLKEISLLFPTFWNFGIVTKIETIGASVTVHTNFSATDEKYSLLISMSPEAKDNMKVRCKKTPKEELPRNGIRRLLQRFFKRTPPSAQ